MLKIQLKDQSREAVWIVEKLYTLGRSASNSMVLDHPSISEQHAKLITRDNKLYLQDLSSEHGCFVNNQRVNIKQLLPGDLLRLGDVEIDILNPRESVAITALSDEQVAKAQWQLVADSSWLSGQAFPVPAGKITIGRSKDCDLIIPGTHLSRQHAELDIQGNLLHIRDLASSNGTFLNDQRITEGSAKPGDRLRFDVYSFRVIGPDEEKDKTQIRRPRSPTITPLEKKPPTADTEKKWKTRPTSPGNRMEPTYLEEPTNSLWPWLGAALLVVALATLAYVLSF